jgi:hypothetical protein
MREIDRLAVAPERELEDAHSRKAKVVAQRLNVGSDDAKVFGDDGQFAKPLS